MSQAAPTPDITMRAAQGGGLVATKLYARPTRANLVVRPRLIGLLEEGLSSGVILVSAPAGFGKTTLLADWLRQRPEPACWLSLDAADNDTSRFLSYVIASVRRVVPGVAGDLAGLLRSPDPPSAEAVLTALVNDLSAAAHHLILVFDDYHVITSPAVQDAVTFLLENLPPNLHLVISTRFDPALPIARLRSRGQVVELRSDDLRFTPDEAAAFLSQTMGLVLSPEQVVALDQRAEGWIAGLQMAALSMRGREDVDGFIRAFAGTNRFILDFLVEEVLAREPEQVQTFLLQTAVLNRLSGPLCDAVTGHDPEGTGGADGQQMLERLEKHNLFVVPLDDNRCWYRYHHLFADLLQARLYQSTPEQVNALLVRAAAWCERAGQAAEAMSYALAARDYWRAAGLVARYWWQVAQEGEIETVWSWLAALPEQVVRTSAPLSVAYCWVLWLKPQISPIEEHLVDAERALGQPRLPERDGQADPLDVTLPAQVATLRSIVARYHNDLSAACAYAERALALIPENLPPQVNAQLRGLGSLALAAAYDGAGQLERAADAYRETIRRGRQGKSATSITITFRLIGVLRLLGRLREADVACRDALRYVQEQGIARLPAVGILHLALAEVLLEQNELEAAEGHLAEGNELGRRSGRLDAAKNAAPALARLRMARGDAGGALAAVVATEVALGEPPPPLARAELLALKARILVRQERLSEAAECVEEAARLAGQDQGQTKGLVSLAAARVQAAAGRPDAAVAQLTRFLAAAEAAGQLGTALELLILRSLAYWRNGATLEAEADLQHALALAEPEGYVRIFVDEGEPLAVLLRRLVAHPARPAAGCSYSAGYLAALLAACAASPGTPTSVAPGRAERAPGSGGSQPLIEPLSERELEVLRVMAEGLTNEQIAKRLIIATGTVKVHIHNISGKLAAQNRAHAVARARELGLL